MYNNKVYVPQLFRKLMRNWYHYYLSYLSATCLEKAVQKPYDWHVLVVDCVFLVSKYAIYKKIKKTNKPNYGKLPVKVI